MRQFRDRCDDISISIPVQPFLILEFAAMKSIRMYSVKSDLAAARTLVPHCP